MAVNIERSKPVECSDGVESMKVSYDPAVGALTIRLIEERVECETLPLNDQVPVHKLPVYAHLNVSCPVAEWLAEEALSLPIWPQMEQTIQDRVVRVLRRTLLVCGC